MTTIAEIQEMLRELAVELGNPEWEAAVPEARPGDEGPLIQRCGLDPSSMPIPLLHACRRRWGVPRAWSHGHCPVCGAWPGFAEICGVERSRYLRCVRCGAAWQAHGLVCVYCRTADHARLGSFVPEGGAPTWAIDVCKACQGYLKVFTALQPSAADQVLLKDLDTVELDLAAVEHGYRRPEGTGYAFDDAA